MTILVPNFRLNSLAIWFRASQGHEDVVKLYESADHNKHSKDISPHEIDVDLGKYPVLGLSIEPGAALDEADDCQHDQEPGLPDHHAPVLEVCHLGAIDGTIADLGKYVIDHSGGNES